MVSTLRFICITVRHSCICVSSRGTWSPHWNRRQQQKDEDSFYPRPIVPSIGWVMWIQRRDSLWADNGFVATQTQEGIRTLRDQSRNRWEVSKLQTQWMSQPSSSPTSSCCPTSCTDVLCARYIHLLGKWPAPFPFRDSSLGCVA